MNGSIDREFGLGLGYVLQNLERLSSVTAGRGTSVLETIDNTCSACDIFGGCLVPIPAMTLIDLTEIFQSSIQANVERVLLLGALSLLSKSFAIHYSQLLQFVTVY
jgi:hypothetical protein